MCVFIDLEPNAGVSVEIHQIYCSVVEGRTDMTSPRGSFNRLLAARQRRARARRRFNDHRFHGSQTVPMELDPSDLDMQVLLPCNCCDQTLGWRNCQVVDR
jgi:hypothetical protein